MNAVTRLDQIIADFQAMEPQMRLELLLDYARKLPPLPEPYRAQRDAGLHRVPECQTPVFLWVELQSGKLRIIADVAEESPTVKGYVSLLAEALEGQPPQAAGEVPNDLLHLLGLADLIRMNRAVGLAAVTARIKREATALSNGNAKH